MIAGELDGLGRACWLGAQRPNIRVILTSGAVRTAELVGELCGLGLLEAKPYHHGKLAERISRAIGERKSAAAQGR